MQAKRSTRLLMPQIAQLDQLMAAWKKVRANRGAAGVDLVTVQHFEANLHANLQANLHALSEALREDRYYPMPLKRFQVPKPDGRTRPLAILAVEDRIVQRAVVDVLEPIFEAEFLPCNFGYRPGRKVEDAIQQVLRYRAQGYEWIVDGDLRDFFGSLDHRLLLRLLADRIKDTRLLRLIQMWLDLGGMRPALPPSVRLAHVGHLLKDGAESSLERGKSLLSSARALRPGRNFGIDKGLRFLYRRIQSP